MIKANFGPPFEKIVIGPMSLVGGALVRLGHFLARVKIWGHSTPYGLPKKSIWAGMISHRDLQIYWTKLHRTCFA